MAGRPRNDEIDARVLEAAVDVLALHGYPGLRIDDVASSAGVAKTTIYRRWPTCSRSRRAPWLDWGPTAGSSR